ncbi:MAG: Asp-tRNA(Asn)/Glu-tRNA(Gln) amidotransferase subunit GatC [Bdellovibrionales bacterium]|nr:Asp-tRNA(Asn)/Glu-tRNA(Gln) amidotransferase subunit GatC [Bdellovibrionales bacterium]
MSLTTEQLRHIAKLAAIRVTDEEIESLGKELNDILAHVDKLGAVTTRGVVPMSHVHGATNFLREDVIRESLPKESIAPNAPRFDEQGFRVPKVIG